MNKYKILEGQYIEVCGKKLYRIQALKDFKGVKSGDIGGYIEKESNLSQSGNAWVSGNARVYGDARVSDDALVSDNAWVSDDALVSGNAWVYGDARVSGNALVSGNAWVSGNARVYGDARVSDDALVSGNAWVSGNAKVSGDSEVYGNARVYGTRHYLNLGPIGSRDRYTTIYRNRSKKAIVVCGCFLGSLDEFERAVHEKHAGTTHEAEYMALIQLARLREKEWMEEESLQEEVRDDGTHIEP